MERREEEVASREVEAGQRESILAMRRKEAKRWEDVEEREEGSRRMQAEIERRQAEIAERERRVREREEEVVKGLKDWLTNHIRHADRLLERYLFSAHKNRDTQDQMALDSADTGRFLALVATGRPSRAIEAKRR